MESVPVYPGAVADHSTRPADSPVKCPKCKQILQVGDDPMTICASCGWKGEVYVFNPVPISVDRAQQALPEDATCLHHPTKRAIAVCAGTGDYICSLCSIVVKGETFSAEYLNNAGSEQIDKTFDRYLERPDSEVKLLILLSFVPYVGFVVVPLSIFWIPYAFFRYSKAIQLRKTNPLFNRAMRLRRVIGIPILLIMMSFIWVLVVIGIFSLIARRY